MMLPIKFRVNWTLSSREEAKSICSRWLPWWPSWILDRNDFSFYWSTSHQDASYQVSNLFKRSQNRFSRKQLWPPSWISDQKFSAIFDLLDNLILPAKFRQLAFRFRRRSKNRFSRRQLWQPSWISDLKDFSYFDLQVTPMLPTKFQVNWPFDSGKEMKNWFSRWWTWWPSLISDREQF